MCMKQETALTTNTKNLNSNNNNNNKNNNNKAQVYAVGSGEHWVGWPASDCAKVGQMFQFEFLKCTLLIEHAEA